MYGPSARLSDAASVHAGAAGLRNLFSHARAGLPGGGKRQNHSPPCRPGQEFSPHEPGCRSADQKLGSPKRRASAIVGLGPQESAMQESQTAQLPIATKDLSVVFQAVMAMGRCVV